MYNPYRPYTMVPKGTSVTVHLEPETPKVSPAMEKPPEEKPQRRRQPKKQRTLRRRSQ